MKKAFGKPHAFDSFTIAFIACGLELCDEEIGNKIFSDINQKSLDLIIADCKKFLEQAKPYLDFEDEDLMDHAGYDFWLTRNGHGVGFWDREETYGEANAKALTALCESYISCDFYRNPGQRWVGWEAM